MKKLFTLLFALTVLSVSLPAFCADSTSKGGFLEYNKTNGVYTDFVVNGTITSTGDFTASGDIVGDGGGAISGMLGTVEVAITGDTLTVAEAGKVIVVRPLVATFDTLTFILPTPVAGLPFTIIAASDDTIYIDPASSDTTILYWVGSSTLDGGDKLANSGVTGDSVTLIGIDTTSWGIKAMHNVWTDGGA